MVPLWHPARRLGTRAGPLLEPRWARPLPTLPVGAPGGLSTPPLQWPPDPIVPAPAPALPLPPPPSPSKPPHPPLLRPCCMQRGAHPVPTQLTNAPATCRRALARPPQRAVRAFPGATAALTRACTPSWAPRSPSACKRCRGGLACPPACKRCGRALHAPRTQMRAARPPRFIMSITLCSCIAGSFCHMSRPPQRIHLQLAALDLP